MTDHRINLTLHKLTEFMEGEIFEIIRRNTEEFWTDKAKDETEDYYKKQIFHQLEQLQEAGSRVSSNRPRKRDRSVLDFSFDETEQEWEKDKNTEEEAIPDDYMKIDSIKKEASLIQLYEKQFSPFVR